MAQMIDHLLPKPAYGSPCNGCGRCCIDQLCPLGELLFTSTGAPCPALLRENGGRLVCGLVKDPNSFRKGDPILLASAAATLIGAGIACDAVLGGEREPSILERRKMIERAEPFKKRARAALEAWGLV